MAFVIDKNVLLGIVIIVAYLLIFLLVRRFFIARPTYYWAKVQIDNVQHRLLVEQERPEKISSHEQAVLNQTKALLNQADNLIERKGLWDNIKYFFVWSGWRELAAWSKIHEAERHAVWLLSPVEVSARLKRAMGQLSELQEEKQDVWRDAFKNAQENLDQSRAYLNQFLADIYDARDGVFATLATLHDKAMWLILIGLLLMTGLMLRGDWLVLLAGAIGGLLSRMQRILISKNIPTDYGVSWITLFLSPITGALAAWAGLHLLILLQTLNVLALAEIIPSYSVIQTPSPPLIGLAILFGISERYLDRVVMQAETKVSPEE